MQFQVPQFIDTEDRIVGPLTLRQFGYLAIAGTLIFCLYFLVNNFAFYIFAAVIGGAGLALAFVKVSGQNLPKIVLSAIRFFWEPNQYVWQAKKIEKAATAKPSAGEEGGFSLEKVVSGFALKSALQVVTTGSKAPETKEPPRLKGNERYQIFRGIGGEQRAAKRIDYR